MTTPWLQHTCTERIGPLSLRCDVVLTSEWTAVFGPSGTGKSTWLRLLAGLIPQQTGSLRLFGEDLRDRPPHCRGIALVEQSPTLFPHHDVEGNVRYGTRGLANRHAIVSDLLRAFELESLRHASVDTLSGGERQRVAMARALASQPRVLLLDEVFTGLDAARRATLLATLTRLSQERRMPVISVSHDVSEVFASADEVLRMEAGRFLVQGPPAAVLADERSALLRSLQATDADSAAR